jgi:serine/threonine protein kinase
LYAGQAAWHQFGLYLSEDRIIEFDKAPLGRGSFAAVHRGIYQRHVPEEVAFKVFSGGALDAKILKQVNDEVKVAMRLNHPNLVKLHGLCELSKRGICLVMELAQGGCLRQVLINRAGYPELPWSVRVRWLLQASQGMRELHSMFPPIVHR